MKYTGEAIHLKDKFSDLESVEEAVKRDEHGRTWSCEERPAPERERLSCWTSGHHGAKEPTPRQIGQLGNSSSSLALLGRELEDEVADWTRAGRGVGTRIWSISAQLMKLPMIVKISSSPSSKKISREM